MTIKTAKARHKKLWNWLAETGDRRKDNCPFWVWNGGKWGYVEHSCFACEVADDNCSDCPIKWPGIDCIDRKSIGDSNGLFAQWNSCLDPDKRKALAAQIRDLPWRDEQ